MTLRAIIGLFRATHNLHSMQRQRIRERARTVITQDRAGGRPGLRTEMTIGESELTDQQAFELVAEHNPELASDFMDLYRERKK